MRWKPECGYGSDLLHGEAVAIGMVMAFDLSVRSGFARQRMRHGCAGSYAAIDLPTTPSGHRRPVRERTAWSST